LHVPIVTLLGDSGFDNTSERTPMAVDSRGVIIHLIEWGEMNMALEPFPVGTDREPIFKGLPDDRGQSLHWGYVP
jgi:hypothetical protein